MIEGKDGRYYMYVSRWPEKLAMSTWVTNSEIVLATSDKPEGPFKFEKVVLPTRGLEYLDSMMPHNPNIHYHDGKYILFYIGVTYDFAQPEDRTPTHERYKGAWNHKRIGVAVADSPYGP